MTKRKRQSGFTLLELVVAMALMGLVLVMLYSGLRMGLNSTDGGERRAEVAQRQRSVEEFLRRQLVQSMTVYRINDRQEKAVAFFGRSNDIEFVAPMLTQLGQGGLYWLRISVANGQLIVRFRPYLPKDSGGAERESVLLNGVSALEWAYFGAERDHDAEPPRWRSDWSSIERRPSLVRLNLAVQGEPWPDLVVALSEGTRR